MTWKGEKMTVQARRMNNEEAVEYLKGCLEDYLESELCIEDTKNLFTALILNMMTAIRQ